MASMLQGAGTFGFIGNGHRLHLILKQRLFCAFIYLFIFYRGKFLPGVDFWQIIGVVRSKCCYHGNLGT